LKRLRYPVLLLLGLCSFWGVARGATSASEEEKRKSTYWAMFDSAIFPGGGQFYTENRGKGVFFFLLQGGFLTATLIEHYRTEKSFNQYEKTLNPTDYEIYSHHFDLRSKLLWWTAGIWVFSMADAYVDAHFYCFEGGEKLSLNFSPTFQGLKIGFILTLR